MNAETRAKEIVEKLLGEKQAFVKAPGCPREAKWRWTKYEATEALIAAAITRAQNDKLEEAADAATKFLVGDPFNGVPLRSPGPHEIAAHIRSLKSKD